MKKQPIRYFVKIWPPFIGWFLHESHSNFCTTDNRSTCDPLFCPHHVCDCSLFIRQSFYRAVVSCLTFLTLCVYRLLHDFMQFGVHISLTMFLLYEKSRGTKSFWLPYLNTLPKTFTTPAYLPDDQLTTLPVMLRGMFVQCVVWYFVKACLYSTYIRCYSWCRQGIRAN